MISLNEHDLRYIMPYCRYPEEWVRPLNQAMERFGIAENVSRVAGFLGQIAVESNSLNDLQENLIYTPQRIAEVWPRRFKTVEDALPYGRNPEKLANKVYADRLGNGPEKSGDGFRYRGRGLIQITGRANYELVGRLLDMPGLVEMPDHLRDQRYAALSAAAWWQHRECNQVADEIDFDNIEKPVTRLTKIINGGTHGLDKRIRFTQASLEVLDVGFEAA